MLLAIDVGNTNIVLGCLEGEKILFTERLSTDTVKTSLEYAILFRTALDIHHADVKQVTGAIISSVVPPITPVIRTALRKITGINAMVVGPGLKTGLNIRIDDPSTVGADLVAGSVGALSMYRPPLVVIDLGTATTMFAVDRDGNFLGGAIMPGVRLSLSSLVSETSMLQAISLDVPKKAIGRNTVDAMRSGILFGHASMLDGILDRMSVELGDDLTAVATGGLARYVIPLCRHKIETDDALIMKGLRVIYEKNSGPQKIQKEGQTL